MHRLGVINSEQLRSAADGARVRVAGLVITRQAPETARGLRFFTLEDEWGHINATIYPDLYRRRRLIANRSPLLMIDGVVQRADGVVSVLAREIAALEDRGSGLAVRAPRAHNYTR
jgi:error-prone DNA polymerase